MRMPAHFLAQTRGTSAQETGCASLNEEFLGSHPKPVDRSEAMVQTLFESHAELHS